MISNIIYIRYIDRKLKWPEDGIIGRIPLHIVMIDLKPIIAQLTLMGLNEQTFWDIINGDDK